MSTYPQRIVCLTEESVETLFLLGKQDLIVGVSHYVERPLEAKALPKVSHFLSGHLDKITALKPDLILGFSDDITNLF
jgi:iron complex transport system substrate-binding protein